MNHADDNLEPVGAPNAREVEPKANREPRGCDRGEGADLGKVDHGRIILLTSPSLYYILLTILIDLKCDE